MACEHGKCGCNHDHGLDVTVVQLGRPRPVGEFGDGIDTQVVLDPPQQVRARRGGDLPGVEAVESGGRPDTSLAPLLVM